jgi:hypothetical protein
LFCRLIIQTCGNGDLILPKVTQSGDLSVIDFSSFQTSYLAQLGPLEGIYFCLEIVVRQIANQNKFGDSRHHRSRGPFMMQTGHSFLQFTFLSGGLIARRFFLQLI